MFRVVLSLSLLVSTAALAQAELTTKQAMAQAQEAPLTIDSDKGISCDRERNTCTATGNVVATKGAFVLHCHELTTFMRKGADGKQQVWKVDAKGNVVFTGIPGEKATGARAIYTIDDGKLFMTADPNDGYTIVIKDDKILKSRRVILFIDESGNSRQLKYIEALEDVTLSTPDEIGYGDKVTYTPATQIATLQGDLVTIAREEGHLKGKYAQINLDTGIAKMMNSADNDGKGRVRAFIRPDKTDADKLSLRKKP
ncbi:MAG: LptA/OstA family protein [Alphaproteobacteria bacterium]